MELLFGEPYLPGLVGPPKVLQAVVAVNVDQIVFRISGGVSLFLEPLVEFVVVYL